MKAILHFGMPKTGTTSIQKTLHALAGRPDAGFVYLSKRRTNANQLVATLFRAERFPRGRRGILRRLLRLVLPSSRPSNIARGYLVSSLAEAGQLPSILSSENIHRIRPEDLQALHALYRSAGVTPHAVGYIRSPKSFMESAFQQRLKTGLDTLDMARLYPAYQRSYEKFITVFGTDHVHFWPFEPSLFKNRCAVQDFFTRLGLPLDKKQVQRVNESLSLHATQMLYAYRKHAALHGGRAMGKGNRLLTFRLAELAGPKLRLHSTLVGPELARHAADIRWMEERLGTSLQEDINRDDERAIRSEADLLNFSPQALAWLAQQLGPCEQADKVRTGQPEAVAIGLHALRCQLEERANRAVRD